MYEPDHVLRIMLTTCEAESPDDDDRAAIFVQIRRGLEDVLVVDLNEETDESISSV